jgi:flagellar hook-basal body complex protein FliE
VSGLFASAAVTGVTGGMSIGGVNGNFMSDMGGVAANAGAASPVPFAGVLQSMVQQTSTLDQKASQAVTGLLNGSGVEIHDAMIATQKASMAFELALQVRNKAVGAYQQMMGMQF